MRNISTHLLFIPMLILCGVEISSAQCSVNAGNNISICQNASGSITASPSNANNYTWTSIPFSSSTPGNPFTIPTATAGTFTYVVTADFNGGGGCTATDTVTVIVNPVPNNPAITASPATTQCAPAAVGFSTPAQSGVSFTWAFGDATSGSGASVSHTYSAPTGSGTTNYTVTVTATASGGCTATATQNISVKQRPDAVLSDPINNFRFCGIGGSGDISVFDASTPSTNSNYLIDWGDGSPNFSSSTAPSGVTHTFGSGISTITYTVTGTNGCTDVSTYTVYNISNPQIGAANPGNTLGCGPRTVCFPINTFSTNDASTTYTVNFGDGSPIQIYSHPPPDTVCHTYTVTSCGQPSNAYTFQVKAANGCDTSYATINPVRIYIQPAPDFIITATPGCVNTPTIFTNTSTNGYNTSCDTGAIYTWNFGDGSANVVTTSKGPQTHTYTTPGLYTVKLSAQNSCGTGIDSTSVCVQSPATPSFTANAIVGCAPMSVTMNNTSTGQNQCGTLTRIWTVTKTGSTCLGDSASDFVFTSGTSSSSVNPVIRFNNQGIYTVTLTLSNSCGTFVTSATTITVKRKPQITLTVPPTICSGQSISPTVASLPCGGTISSYSWSFPGGSPSSSTSQIPGAITYNTSGGHTVSVTVTNECGNTSASGSVNVLPPPVANAGPDAQFCSGGSAILGAAPTGGLTYSWTPGTGLNSTVVANPTVTLTNNGTTPVTTTYILTVTNAATCTAKDTVLVTVYPPATVNASADQSVCSGAGQSINVSGTIGGSATSSTWTSNNGGTFGNPSALSTTYTPSISSGAVIITLTTDDPVGPCPAVSDNLTLTVIAPPVPNAGADVSFCSGGSAILGAAAVGGITYQWSPTTGLSSGTAANPTVTLTNNGTSPVTFTYVLTATNASTCSAKDTVLVTVYPPATVNAGAPQTVCAGGTVTLGGSFGGSATSATWSSPSGTFSDANSLTSTFTPTISSGMAVVTLTTNDPAGPCPAATTTVIITVNAIPVVTLPGNQTVCSGAATTTVTFSSSVGGTTYAWSGSSANGVTGFPASGTSSNIPSFTPTNPNNTAGTIVYTVTPTASSCPGTPVTYIYTVPPRPDVIVPAPQTICSGGTTTAVTLTSNVSGTTFSWTATASGVTGFTASGSGNIPAQPLTNSGTTTGTVTYTITPSASGCPGTPVTYVITVYPVPNVILPATQTICSGGTTTPVNLTSGVSGTTFSWSATSGSITGFTSNGIGNIPAQTLTNSGTVAGTVVYSITPSANSCAGTPQNYTVTVNPIPVATATPSTATICSGTQANIALTSNVSGTTFVWTVSAPGSISGASNGSGVTIQQTLTSSSTTPQTVTYTITPTANGCPGLPITVTITVNPGATVTFSPTPQILCSGQTSVPVILSSTTVGATFTWTSQANGAGGVVASGTDTIPAQTLTNSTNAITQVVYSAIASFSGCNSPAATYTITVNPIPAVTPPSNQTVCSGAATAVVTFTSSVTGTTYTWSGSSANGVTGFPASGTSSNIPSFTPSNPSATAGTIDYSITPTANGCPGTPVTLTYTINPRPDVITSAPQTVCSGATTTAVTLSSNVSNTTFGWTATASGVTGHTASGTGDIPAQTLTNSGTTIGTVTYTITPTASSCPGAPVSYVITVNPLPNVILPAPQTICSGATTTAVTLNSNVSGTTFSWTAASGSITGFTASGTGNIPAETLFNSGTTAGTVIYSITPTVNSCPGTPQNYTVTVNPIPVATASPDTSTICTATQTNISLTSNVSGTTFTWTVSAPPTVTGASNGSGSTIQQTLTNSSGVSQQVTYTVTPSANGCPGSPITVVVFVNQSATITFSPAPQSLCSGETSQTVFLSSTGGAAFTWTSQANGAGGVAVSGTDSIPAQTLTNTTNAPIQVVYSATASFSGCGIPSNTYTITVNPIPDAILPADQGLCSGLATSVVNITSPVSGATFAWIGTSPDGVTNFPANGNSSSIPSFVPNNPNNTTGSINYTITPSANGCPGTPVPYLYTISPVPVADPVPTQTICSNQTTTAVTPVSNVSGTSFNWSSAVSGSVSGNTSAGTGDIPAETLVNSGTTIGTVTYTITPTVSGCAGGPVNFIVTVNPIPDVLLPAPQTICSNQSTAQVTITSNVSGTTFAWSATASSGDITGFTANGTGNIPAETISNSGATSETITYTIFPEANACPGPPQNYTVTIDPIPVMSATPLFDSICTGTQTNISMSSGTAGTTFSWIASAPVGVTGASNGTGNLIQQSLTNINPTIQTVTYTITPTANGCPGAAVVVSVTVSPGIAVQFSPAPQTICSGENTQEVVISSVSPGIVFSWTSSSSGLSGVAVSGADTIPVQMLVNNTNTTATATYTAVATYGSCSSQSATYDISVLPTPDVILPPVQSICSGSSTSVINLSSNVSGTTFTWTGSSPDGITGFIASGNTSSIPATVLMNPSSTSSGTVVYSVTPTSSGCPGVPVDFVITVSPMPDVNVPSSQAICSGETSILVSPTSSLGGITFSWVASAGVNIAGFTAGGTGDIPAQTISNTGTTTDSVVYSITPNSGGCAGGSVSYVITVYPVPDVILPAPQTICSNQSTAQVTITSNVSGTTFTWSATASSGNITGFTANGTGNIPAEIISNSGATSETVTYTITPEANACPGPPQNYLVTIDPIPVMTATPLLDTICTGTQTNISMSSGTAGTTFSWIVSAPAGVSGASNGTGNQIQQNLTNADPTIETVTYTITPTANGCPGADVVVLVTVSPAVTIQFAPSPQTICSGQNTQEVIITSASPGVIFSWTSSASGLSGVAASGADTIPVQTLVNSTYTTAIATYTAVATYGSCSSQSATYDISVLPTADVVLPPAQSICSGTSTSVINLGSNVSGTTFTWTGASPDGVTGFIASGNTSSIPATVLMNPSSTSSGTVVYSVTPTSSGCPGAPVDFVITVSPMPDVSIPAPQEICSGATTVAVTPTSSTSGITFTWVANAGANISGFTASGTGDIPAQTIFNTGTTIDSVVYSITPSSGGCAGAFINYAITVFPQPDVLLPAPQTICSGASTVAVTLTSNVSGTTFVWTASAPSNITGFTASGAGDIPAQTIFNSGTTAGTVTYTITPTANLCDGPIQDYVVTVNPDVVIASTPPSDTICANTQTNFSLSSNVAGTTFSWTVSAPVSVSGAANGTGNLIQQTLSNTSQTQQTVVYTVTPNANACNGQPITINAVVNPVSDILFSLPPQTICSEQTTTQVDITSGTPGASFTWTSQANGVTGVTASGTNIIPAQTLTNSSNVPVTVNYFVTSGFGGCAGNGSTYSVLVNPTPLVILPSDQTVCSGVATNPVLLTSNVSGTTFTWSGSSPNGVTNFTPSGNTTTIPSQTPINPNLATGTVIYTVTPNANSCGGPASDYIITVNPSPDIIMPAPQTICNGSTSNPVAITSTVGGATFTWTSSTVNITGNTPSGSGDIPAQTLQNATPFVDSVIYNVSVVASGCDGNPSTYIIYVNPTPTVSIPNAPQVICSGEPSQEVVISSITPNVNIVWTAAIPAGMTGAIPSGTGNIPSQIFHDTILSTITYTVQANTIGTVCPGTPVQYQITVKPIPQIDFLQTLTGGCSPFVIDVVPVTTNFGIPDTLIFNWGDGSASVNAYPSPQAPYWNTLRHIYYNTDTVPLTFNISMSGSNQCLDTTIVHPVTVLPNVVNAFFVPSVTSGCEPLTVNFQDLSTGAAILSWCFDYDFASGICNGPSVVNVPGSVVTHTFSAGSYTVALYINNGFGCAQDTSYQIITVAPAPIADFATPNVLCGESTVSFINQSTPAAGSFLTAFDWQFGDGGSSNLTSPQHFYSASGTYNVCLTATTSSGCNDSTCKPVTILDKPNVAFTFKDTCANKQPIVFTNNSTVATFYQWTFGDGNTSSLVNPSNNYLSAGIYIVTLIGTTNTCSDTVSQTVTVYPVPDAAFTAPAYNCGTPSNIPLVNNSTGANSYAWDFGNATTSTAVSPVAVYSLPANYIITLDAANQFNCHDTALLPIDIYPLPVIHAVDVNAEGCEPLIVSVNANTTNGNIFTWNFGDGTSPVTFNSSSASYTYRDTGTYTITLQVFSSGTCDANVVLTDTIKVHIRAIADFDYLMNLTEEPVNGTVVFTNHSRHADTYIWDFGDGFESYEKDPVHLYESLGTFTTTLVANNRWDCPDTVTKTFDVFKKGLYVPNAFAPDFGGSNELVKVWQPVGIGIREYHAQVFNTWGELLWESYKLVDTKPAEAWDGWYQGKECHQDVYVWKVNAVFLDGTLWEGMKYTPSQRKKTIGSVTLIR